MKVENTFSDGEQKHSRKNFAARYIVISVSFVIVAILYAISIGRIQLEFAANASDDDETSYRQRTVAIQAVRGEIFDRNGVALVTNDYKYSLIFDYSAMSRSTAEQNAAILSVLRTIEAQGATDCIPETSSPIRGEYPNLYYDTEMLAGSTAAARLKRIINANELEEGADAVTLGKKLAEKYRMVDKSGNMLYTAEEISELLRVRYEMEVIRFSAVEPYVFAKGVGMEVITAVSEASIRGVDTSVSYSRIYHYPGYASHILGRISKIYAENAEYYTSQGYPVTALVGVDGCEKTFESYLRGMDGEMLITEDEAGNVVNVEIVKDAVAGKDVYLTIDIELQIAAEDALKKNVEDIVKKALEDDEPLDGEDADAGALVVQTAEGGEILALASYPTYDLSTFGADYNELINDKSKPLFNRALQGTYAPGSTFKVGVALAALCEQTKMADGVPFSADTIIKTTGKYKYYDDYQPACWIYSDRYKRNHGSINVTKAIQVSCNCFFYEVGRLLGIDNINSYGKIYGLGQPTGIELPEASGVLADSKYKQSVGQGVWVGGDTIATAIGQAYNRFTPIQISNYIATIVNGGNRYSAHLLHSVKSFSGETAVTYEDIILDKLNISKKNYNTIIDAMSSVVEYGSAAKGFEDFPIAIGGKTGTAQISKNQSDNAAFVAFAPLNDPEIVVSCVIEKGVTGLNTTPAVRAAMECYFGLGQWAKPEVSE